MAAATEAFTSAGTTLGVSAVLPSTHDAAGFGALTFTTIGEITDLGELGREYALVTHNPVGTKETIKRKGSYNDGSMALQMARTPGDAGQILMLAALDANEDYAYEMTLQDGTIMYFRAQCMSYKTAVGSVDTITAASVTLEISKSIVEVAPA